METITRGDRDRLRALAAQQAELAASDGMKRLYADWRAHGRFEKSARPMLTIEMGTFADEIIPGMLRCEGARARRVEAMLLSNVIPHTLFGDDTPIRDHVPVALKKRFAPLGLDVRKQDADDSGAAGVGHHFETYLHDLEEDWGLLGPSRWALDVDAAQREVEELGELFGDLLPVRRAGETLCVDAAEDLIHLMAMEDLYVAMIDTPELVHEMVERLLSDYHRYLDEWESRGLILPTAGDEPLPQGSYCFDGKLPDKGSGLHCSQVWGHMNAEEMNDVSPGMYREFIIDHYRPMAARFGALSFGCCEAVHKFWDGCIETLPNLRKVSISAWCDETMMGERLRGREIVYLRKPTANLLGVGSQLDEDAVRAHFRHTAEAASGCRLEITQRDVYLIHGGFDKVARYISLARESAERYWKA